VKKAVEEVKGWIAPLSPATFDVNWPVARVEVGLANEEHPDRYCVQTKGTVKVAGAPLIGLRIQGDIIDGVIKLLSAGATATVVGSPVAALLLVLNYGRRKLGAGIFAFCDGNIIGEIAHTIQPLPWGETKGKLGGEIAITLEARAAKPGSFFVLRFLSKLRVGGTGGLEASVTKVGADDRGCFLLTECKFTGIWIYYGMAKGLKTTREYDHKEHGSASKSGIVIVEEKEFWKDKKTYVWPPGGKKPVAAR
jgi:hypothetical protein